MSSFVDNDGYYINRCGMCIMYPIDDISKATPRGYVCPKYNSGWLGGTIGMAFEDSCNSQRNDRSRRHKDIKKAYENLIRKCGRYEGKSYWSYIMTTINAIINTSKTISYYHILGEFRDNYMQNKIEYWHYLVQYDIYGPIIAQKIYTDSNKINVANYLINNYLNIVVDNIINNNYEQAIIIYVKMVNDLKNYYHIDNIIKPKTLTRKKNN